MGCSFQSTAFNQWAATAANGWAGGVVELGGQVSAQGLLDAAASLAIPLAGSIASATGLLSALSGPVSVASTIPGICTLTARIDTPVHLAATLLALTDLGGALFGSIYLSSAVTALGRLDMVQQGGLRGLSQTQRAALRSLESLYLITWELDTATLYFSDRDYTYRYGSSELLFESYLLEIAGLGSFAEERGGLRNTEVRIKLRNDPWGGHQHLIRLNDTNSFVRSKVSIHELILVDETESFLGDVRVLIWRGVVERVEEITAGSFVLCCCLRLYDARDKLSLQRVVASQDPYADPDDIGKWRNIIYGSVPGVVCRAVKAGAQDTLAEDISAGSATITVSGVTRMAFQSSGTIQIDDEVITYTGFSSRTFTGCTRGASGTQAAPHQRGRAVWQVLSEYIYEVAAHPVKDITAVYVDGVRQTGGYTAYTGQPGSVKAGYEGRAVVVFTVKPVATKQVNITVDVEHGHATTTGSHSHGISSLAIYNKAGVQASGGVNPNNAIDGSGLTSCTLQQGAAALTVQLESGTYGGLQKIVVCLTASYAPNLVGKRLTVKYGGPGGQVVGQITAVSGVGQNPTPFRLTHTTSSWFDYIYIEAETVPNYGWGIWDVTCEFHYVPSLNSHPADGVSTSRTGSTTLGGNSTADLVVGREVVADVQGIQDDSSGSVTGTPNMLIERPDHVFRHLLRVLGFSPADIGASFSEAGAQFGSKGYLFAFVMHDVATDAMALLSRLAFQCRCLLCEWGGKFELFFLPEAAPPVSLALDQEDLIEEPLISFVGSTQLRNKMRAFYKRIYGRQGGPNAALASGLDPDAVAAGYLDLLVVLEPPGDLSEDIYLPAVRTSAMAQDVLAFWFQRARLTRKTIRLVVGWRTMCLAPGSYFSYDDPIFGQTTYRVTRFSPDRARARILLEGVQA